MGGGGGLHADQDRRSVVDHALGEGDVLDVAGRAAVDDGVEASVYEVDVELHVPTHELLLHAAEGDQVGDRDHLQAELPGKGVELGATRHRPVVLQDLADHAGWTQAGEARQVDRALGVPGPDEHAPFAGDQRKDVARAGEIPRRRAGVHGDANRRRPIRRADPGRDAFAGLDRDGEGRLELGGVVPDHQRQVELGRPLLRERQADQPSTVLRHEVHPLRGDLLGGEHDVALVLPIFVVDQDHGPTAADLFDGFGHAGERHGLPSGRWAKDTTRRELTIRNVDTRFHLARDLRRREGWNLSRPIDARRSAPTLDAFPE